MFLICFRDMLSTCLFFVSVTCFLHVLNQFQWHAPSMLSVFLICLNDMLPPHIFLLYYGDLFSCLTQNISCMHNFPKKGKCGGSDFNKRLVRGMSAHLKGTLHQILRNPVFKEVLSEFTARYNRYRRFSFLIMDKFSQFPSLVLLHWFAFCQETVMEVRRQFL